MKTRNINRTLVFIIVLGVGLAVIGYKNSVISAREAVSATELSSAPPSPKTTKLEILPGKPLTISVRSRSKILIDKAPMDQNLLSVNQNGVVPGEDPGLFVKDMTSTLPASRQNGTVIVGGHAYAESPMVFNPLSELTQVDIGHSSIVLNMPRGELSYTIEAIYIVDKIDLPTQKALADNRPGRIELITCDVRNGSDTFQNRIVVGCDEFHPGCGTAI